MVAEAHQGRESPARHRAVGLKLRAAVGDGDGLAAVQLMDRAVAGDEEAPFREVASGGGGVKETCFETAATGAQTLSGRCRMAAASDTARSPRAMTL